MNFVIKVIELAMTDSVNYNTKVLRSHTKKYYTFLFRQSSI